FCKHGIALLLYWLNKKKEVPKVEGLKEKLLGRSKDELAEIVLKAARSDRRLLERISRSKDEPIAFEAFEGRVRQIFGGRDHYWDYYQTSELAEELEELLDEGTEYLEGGDAKSALACFEAVAYGISKGIKKVDDSNGKIGSIFDEACEKMVEAFNLVSLDEGEADGKLQKWMKLAFDDEYGLGDNLQDELAEKLGVKFLPAVQEIAEKMLSEEMDSRKRSYKYGAIVDFILTLNLRQGKIKEFINNAEKHFSVAFERLIDYHTKNKEYEKAAEAAERALPFAKGFVESEVLEKLAQAQEALGKKDLAFKSMFDAFMHDWDIGKYEQLKKFSDPEVWPKKRAEIIRHIENSGETDVLAQVLAFDEDIEGLKRLLSKLTEEDDNELRIIEKALRKKAPESAAEALKLLTLSSLRWSNRNGYRMAADYLKRAKDLLAKNKYEKELVELSKFIENLRQENKRKPALQEEFRKI
ncbi:MAG: hypothetical protein AB1468_01015, partial [Candidatus Micrarchaeota archaeon]